MCEQKLVRINTILTSIDARASIKEWVRAVIGKAPGPLRESVMSQLLLAVLDMRSALPCREHYVVDGDMVDASCFEVAMDMSVRRIRLASRALHRWRCPVLLVPQRSLFRARNRTARARKRVAVEVLGLETAFATAIILQAGKQCRSTASIWEDVISRYNRSVRNGTLPFIHIKWKNTT
jgi:hypothetical protein